MVTAALGELTVGAYVRALARWRGAVLVGWLLATIGGAAVAARVVRRTRVDFDMPRHAAGHADAARFDALFPEKAVTVSALVTRRDGGPVLGEPLRALTNSLRDWAADAGLDASAAVAGWYPLADRGLARLATPYVSEPSDPNGSLASLIVLRLPKKATDASDPLPVSLAARVRAAAPDASADAARGSDASPLVVKLIGQPYFLHAALDGVTRELLTVHPKVVPLACAPFLFIVRSWRLSAVALACIGATAGGAFVAVFALSFAVTVCDYAPTMMLSATLATSIDYSLFLLSRFREELPAGEASGAETLRAVEAAVRTAGHTVAVSGSILALCFLGLSFFPVALISTLGLATALTIAISVLVSLTLLPACLLAAPRFFTSTGCCGYGRAGPAAAVAANGGAALDREHAAREARRTLRGVVVVEAAGGSPDADDALPPSAPDVAAAGQRAAAVRAEMRARAAEGRFWPRLANLAVGRGRWPIVCVFAALAVPCALELARIRVSHTQQELMPRRADASVAWTATIAVFGAGSLFPFEVLLTPADGAVDDAAFFARARAGVRRALALTGAAALVTPTGVMLSGNADVPFGLVHHALHADAAGCARLDAQFGYAVCTYARLSWARFTDGEPATGRNASATFVSLATEFDPFSAQGARFVEALRLALATVEREAGGACAYGLSGDAVTMHDTVALVYARLPATIAATLAVVFALLAAAFRSLVVPARAVASIALSLAVALGCAWAVYGRGALGWVGWAAVGPTGSLTWTVPVMAWPIMLGLGLDYDVFLLGRVLEYRMLGMPDREAIAAGVAHSGPLISAAGCIMALAFGALLLSGSTSLNQLAFLLTFAVLFDTFVVRTLLVPALMSLLGGLNWWPRALPPPAEAVPLQQLPSEHEEHACGADAETAPADGASASAGAGAARPGNDERGCGCWPAAPSKSTNV